MDVAERMNCPLDYTAVGALVALSAVVGRQVAIKPQRRDDWTVVPNLWGGIVGRPGMLKTPALTEAMRPLSRLEASARERYEGELQEHKAAATVAKQAAKVTEQQIGKALKDGDQQMAHELALAAQQAEQAAPVRQRYQTQDSTVEKIGELLASNPRGILIFRDELIGWLRSMDKDGHEAARAFYLEAWNGTGGYIFDRIGRGTVDIEAACVSVLGGIQPGPLQAYIRHATTGGAGDDGLLQRLQVIVWPDPPKTWTEVDRWPDSRARQAAFDVFNRLDNIDPEQIGAERDELPFLRFDAEAQEAFSNWRARLEHRLRNEDHAPAFEAALSKQRSLLPSLALLIHLADSPKGGPVTIRPTLQAIAWTEYLEAHARRLYAPALDMPAHAARALGQRIKASEVAETFQARDIYRKHWAGLDRDATHAALERLESIGWVRPVEIETGGRPRIDYQINPRCRS
jgi:putative DNA primase/helicase